MAECRVHHGKLIPITERYGREFDPVAEVFTKKPRAPKTNTPWRGWIHSDCNEL